MKPIFGRGPSIQLKLFALCLLSGILIFLDRQVEEFVGLRTSLLALATPIQFMAQAPGDVLDFTSRNLLPRRLLVSENQRLKQQLLLQSEQIQQMAALDRENAQLRALLKTEPRAQSRRMVSEVMSIKQDPFSKQIVIDKGALQGVYEGQPVLDHHGVVGQVLHVGPSSSTVLLVADRQHGIPVRVLRSGVRTIANGSGGLNQLLVNHIPFSSDIQVGDTLVTSGLGNRFPAGYPVAEVSMFEAEEGQPFATVRARPLAQLDRLRYVLLLWPQDAPQPEDALKPEDAESEDAESQQGDTPADPDQGQSGETP